MYSMHASCSCMFVCWCACQRCLIEYPRVQRRNYTPASLRKKRKLHGPGLFSLSRPLTGLGLGAPAQSPQMKSQIELFVGNIPVGTTQQGLIDFLNAAMLKVGLNLSPGNPVASCRLNSKFAFCVMRSPDEAAKALNLNGIPYLGNMLKLQRPSSYTGPPDRAVTWQLSETCFRSTQFRELVTYCPRTPLWYANRV